MGRNSHHVSGETNSRNYFDQEIGSVKKKWKKPYHASYVEMGTYKDMAQPFMRPAVKKNKRKANRMYREALE